MNKEKLLISVILFKYNVPIEEAKIVGTYIEQLENQNKAYENMRKDLLIKLKGYDLDYLDETNEHNLRELIEVLLNILNKVGGNDE